MPGAAPAPVAAGAQAGIALRPGLQKGAIAQ